MSEIIKKFLLCLLPFFSGLVFKFYYYASPIKFFYIYLPELIFAIGSLILFFLCKHLYTNALNNNSKQLILLFDYQLPSISFLIVSIPFILCCIILPFTHDALSAFLRTVIIGVTVEELLARGILIKYPDMSGKEFLVWGTLSNISFSLNHWLYDTNYVSLAFLDQMQKFLMHFSFGILLSGLLYKAKNIEVPLFRHYWSNFSVYIYRFCPSIGAINYLVFFLLDYLLLIGLGSKMPKRHSVHSLSVDKA